MLKKLAVIFTVLTIVSMLLVPIAYADATPQDFVYLDMSENKTWYTGDDATDVALKVYGVTTDGTRVDISNDIATFASDNTAVFYFNGNKLCSTGRTGKATVTVSYVTATKGTLTKTMLFARQADKTEADQPITSDFFDGDKETYATSGAAGTPTGGHLGLGAFGGFPNDWALRLMRKSWVKDHDPANAHDQSLLYRWWDSGYRSFGIWFYDDGLDTSSSKNYCGLSTILICDSALMHQATGDFAADYGYTPALYEKWKDKKGYKVIDAIFRGASTYYCSGNGFGLGSGIGGNDAWAIPGIARTEGWHQLICSLEKNSEAEYGWSVYSYFDGKLFATADVVPTDDATNGKPKDSNGWAAMEVRPMYVSATYKTYIGDGILMGSLETEDTSKTLTGAIGEGGSVTVNGEAFANGASLKLEPDSDIAVKVTPNSGYDVDSVKLGDTVLALNTSNEASFRMPVSDATLTVAFAKKTAADAVLTSISLTKNKNYYINENATDVPLNVVGYYDDGTEGDITEGVTFTSSDSKVFKVEGGKVSSTAIDGKAIITASVGGKTANLLMVHSTFATTNPDLAKFEVTGDPGTATGGHYDGASSDTLHEKISANWNVRLSLEGTDWFSNGYRTIGGWFYDDMNVSDQSYNRRGFATIRICDMIGTNSDFVSDWGYGAFADKWKDMKSVEISGSMMTNATATASDSTMLYKTNPTTFGIINGSWGFKARTKGWHHVMFSIEKNPSAAYGWTMYFYMDGELLGFKDIVPTDVEKPANNSYFTLQGNSSFGTAGGTSAYFDEIYATGSLEPVDTTKTLTGAIGENGSVTVNGEAFGNGATVKLEENADINIKAMPNAGYEVDEVKLDDTVITLNASGEATAKMPAADATLTVTFKAAPSVPTIDNVSVETNAKYEGSPAAVVYAKVNGTAKGAGVVLKNAEGKEITLPAFNGDNPLTTGAFGIRVFGKAMVAGENYSFIPYITYAGDVGDETVSSAAQNFTFGTAE